jgi:hypothetical protein
MSPKPEAIRKEMTDHVEVLPGGGLRVNFTFDLTPGDLVCVAGTPTLPYDQGGMTCVIEHLVLWALEVQKVRNRARRQGIALADSARDPRYGIVP